MLYFSEMQDASAWILRPTESVTALTRGYCASHSAWRLGRAAPCSSAPSGTVG